MGSGASIVNRKQFTMPDSLPPRALPASDLRLRPPAFSTWAARAPLSSIGSMPATTGGTMVLRLDDTDVERNTEASVQSIFEGLRWLGLDWDEEYKQSERLALHRQQAEAIFAKGLAYRDFTPAHAGDDNQSSAQGAWLFNPGMRELSARRKRPPRRRRRAVRPPLSRAARRRPHPAIYRWRLRRAVQARRRGRRLRSAAFRRHADLSPGLLR